MAKSKRSGKEAVEELRALYDSLRNLPKGQRLTQARIQKAVGVKTMATVSCWLAPSDSSFSHEPRGSTLDSLNRFLDKCQNPEYIQKITK
jgi:hypothetical protein